MNIALRLFLLLTLLFGGGALRAQALIPGQVNEDIDLFLYNPLASAGLPNVLIIWDNTANWGQTVDAATAYDIEKKALSTVISNLPTNPDGSARFNVGLMLFTETGGGNSNIRGAYPRYAFRPMNAANKAALSALIDGLHTLNDRGSNAQYGKAMHEAYLWLGGKPPLAGQGQLKRDCAAFGGSLNILGLCVSEGSNYVSPVVDGCQKNFIILISNGTTDSGENNETQGLLKGLKGVLANDPIPLSPSGEQANWADEYSRFGARTGFPGPGTGTSTATVYTIGVYDRSREKTNPVQGQIRLAQSSAFWGNGKYFDGTDLSSIQQALDEIFILINEVDGVFASTTLPVSVNVRGTQLNQLYMGVFRPDPKLSPRWPGNLKMYKLALQGENVILADAAGIKADDANTGFINATAVSHWTSASTFWGFDPTGVGGASDSPDGPIVEKGAVAQILRTTHATDQSGRKLYTCTGTCSGGNALSGTPFSTANADITQAALGAADATERDNIINWVRGQDNKDNENANKNADDTPNLTDARASIHGDVLHSRPAVINYNRNGDNNDVYAFYGSNDGVFRGVKGAFGGGAGAEVWGFIPSEFFGKLKRLRDNAPAISLASKRPYFMDGPIGVYQFDNPTTSFPEGDGKLIAADGDKVYLYIGMRRGGRFIYALDVSDPEAPKMLWKKSSADAGFGELGFTWSEPKVAKIRAHANPVLIMGAGYDPRQDDNPILNPDQMGRGIMVLDAFTGELLWQAGFGPSGATNGNVTVSGMDYSIPSDVTILDRNSDGFIDRLYVGDTGGNIWRVDIDSADYVDWAVNKLAALAGTNADEKRKFLFPPDVVFNPGAEPGFDSVLIGSGDREHPFDLVVQNRFYMIKDPDTGLTSSGGAAITEADLFSADSNIIQTGDATQSADARALLDAASGWMLSLGKGEKVISGSVTVAGTTFFNTNQPGAGTSTVVCTTLGLARQYAVSFEDATATLDFNADGTLATADRSVGYGTGYLPSPVPVVTQLGDDNRLYQVVVAGSKVTVPPQAVLESRFRTYWYLRAD